VPITEVASPTTPGCRAGQSGPAGPARTSSPGTKAGPGPRQPDDRHAVPAGHRSAWRPWRHVDGRPDRCSARRRSDEHGGRVPNPPRMPGPRRATGAQDVAERRRRCRAWSCWTGGRRRQRRPIFRRAAALALVVCCRPSARTCHRGHPHVQGGGGLAVARRPAVADVDLAGTSGWRT
jgi:hypothetical protein